MRAVSLFSRLSERDVHSIAAGILIAVPVVLASVPMSIFEQMPAVCLLRRAGIPCWGCGMTRALASALRADFSAAWTFNHFVVVVAPILAWMWARELVKHLRRV